ncbi:Rho-related protein racH [Taenia solium]|eukprot:TsM_000783800 transcript=TsM_000783800 gene=TsM_000783800
MLVDVRKATYELRLVETHDQEIDKMFRKLIYPGTSVFMLCFAVDQQSSFDSAAEKTGVDDVFDRAAQIAAGTKTKKPCSVM